MAIFSKKKQPIPFGTFLRIMKELDIINSFKGSEFKDLYNRYIVKEINNDWWYPFFLFFYMNGKRYRVIIDDNASSEYKWWRSTLDCKYSCSYPCSIEIRDEKNEIAFISYCMPKEYHFMYEVFMVIFAIAAEKTDAITPYLSSLQTKVFKCSTRWQE